MDILNPIAASLLQSSQVQRQQSAGKQRQLRRVQAIQKNVAAQDEQSEHQVESAEELPPVHDKQGDPQQQKKRRRAPRGQNDLSSEDQPRLDLTA